MVEIFNIQMYHFSVVGVFFYLPLNRKRNEKEKKKLVVLNDICCVARK